MRHSFLFALVPLAVASLGLSGCSRTTTAVAPESITDLPVAATERDDAGRSVPDAEVRLDAGIADAAVAPESTIDVRIATLRRVLRDLLGGVVIAVTVRDDTNRPMPDAEVRLDHDIVEYTALYRSTDPWAVMMRADPKRGQVVARTDVVGHATIVVARGKPLAVRACCPDHVPAMAMFFDSLPTAIDLVVSRAGRIAGHIDDPAGLANHAMWIKAWPQGSDLQRGDLQPGDPHRGQHSISIDAAGVFHSGALLPGPWFVALEHYDMSRDRGSSRPPQAVPLLGSGIDERTRTLVVVPPAGTVEVTLRSPPLARIDGHVWANGMPVGDIVVFGVTDPPTERFWDEGFNPAWLDAPKAHEHKPYARTAADGSFTMHVATTGTYELRARHPRQPVASPPTLVEVRTLSDRITVEVELPAGALRGRYCSREAGPIALSAQLYPATAATSDPFYHGDDCESEANDRLRIGLDDQGAFDFECVPPGDYVLRLSWEPSYFDHTIVWQSAVTVGTGSLDLGELVPPTKVTGSAIVLSPGDESLGAWIRQTLPGVPKAFVRTVWVPGGRLWLDELPAGCYQVQFFTPWFFGGRLGLSGIARGNPIEIELRADGTTEPKVVTLP